MVHAILFVLLSLLSLTAWGSSNLLHCSSLTYNPTIELEIVEDSHQSMGGKVESVISGFAGIERTSLGESSLDFILNPSTCELAVKSTNLAIQEFMIFIPLKATRLVDGVPGISARFSGSLVGDMDAFCVSADNELTRSLIAVCEKHPSLNSDIVFKKTTDVALFLSEGQQE